VASRITDDDPAAIVVAEEVTPASEAIANARWVRAEAAHELAAWAAILSRGRMNPQVRGERAGRPPKGQASVGQVGAARWGSAEGSRFMTGGVPWDWKT
jgi:hypothetical protein